MPMHVVGVNQCATWWILCHEPSVLFVPSVPYCYQIESRARVRGFSLPSISTKHYRCAGAQPSSYFPSCPFYIYRDVYGIVSRRHCEFSFRSVHRSVTLHIARETIPKILISGLIEVSLNETLHVDFYIMCSFLSVNIIFLKIWQSKCHS